MTGLMAPQVWYMVRWLELGLFVTSILILMTLIGWAEGELLFRGLRWLHPRTRPATRAQLVGLIRSHESRIETQAQYIAKLEEHALLRDTDPKFAEHCRRWKLEQN